MRVEMEGLLVSVELGWGNFKLDLEQEKNS